MFESFEPRKTEKAKCPKKKRRRIPPSLRPCRKRLVKIKFFVLEADQSSQAASGAPCVASRCPFLVPPRVVHPASVKKVISSQILSLHRYKCWPTRLCHPNGPGLGGVLITLAAMYLQGLLTQPALVQPFNTKGTTNPFISWL